MIKVLIFIKTKKIIGMLPIEKDVARVWGHTIMEEVNPGIFLTL